MATINIELPEGLDERLEQFAAYEHTDLRTLIIWAVAERSAHCSR